MSRSSTSSGSVSSEDEEEPLMFECRKCSQRVTEDEKDAHRASHIKQKRARSSLPSIESEEEKTANSGTKSDTDTDEAAVYQCRRCDQSFTKDETEAHRTFHIQQDKERALSSSGRQQKFAKRKRT